MKLISWNVNGIRACITKGFEDRFHELDADVFCTGIMPTDGDIPELLFLQKKNQFLWQWGSALRNMTKKAA